MSNTQKLIQKDKIRRNLTSLTYEEEDDDGLWEKIKLRPAQVKYDKFKKRLQTKGK